MNIAIHLCNALLLYGIVRRTLLRRRLVDTYDVPAAGFAFAIALLWTVHPLNTEAVNYITERTESLMAMMYLLTLYASIRALDDRRSNRWQWGAITACALGMACKESMVTAPIIVMLYDSIFAFDSVGDAFRRRWRLYFGLALTWLLLAFLIFSGPRSGSAGFSTGVTPWTYLLNQTGMIVRYLRLTFWPTSLVINYGQPVTLTLTDVLPEAIVMAALLIGTLLALVRKPEIGFLGLWFFITLAPTSSIVPIATEVAAERRMYLPLIALIAFLVVTSGRWFLERTSRTVAAIVMLVVLTPALGALTRARNRDYASALTLAQSTLARWPSDTAHAMVGSELAALGRDDEALPELRIAAATDPRARYNLGVTLFNKKDYAGAIYQLEVLAKQHPLREEIPMARRTMGTAFAHQQKWPEAIEQYRLVLSMRPSDPETKRLLVETLVNQGIAMGSDGRFMAAITSLRQALALDPTSAIARHNLATALYDNGDTASALVEARKVVASDPDYAASYDLIGRILALQGQYDEAVAQLQQAVRLAPNDPQFLDDLNKVREVTGR